MKHAGQGVFGCSHTVWVDLGILAGVGLGLWVQGVFAVVAALQFARTNLVVAVFLWGMICPLMIPIDIASFRNVGQRPRRLVPTGRGASGLFRDGDAQMLGAALVMSRAQSAGLPRSAKYPWRRDTQACSRRAHPIRWPPLRATLPAGVESGD